MEKAEVKNMMQMENHPKVYVEQLLMPGNKFKVNISTLIFLKKNITKEGGDWDQVLTQIFLNVNDEKMMKGKRCITEGN